MINRVFLQLLYQKNKAAVKNSKGYKLKAKSLKSLLDLVASRKCGVECTGVTGSEKAYIISKIYDKIKNPVCVIAPTQKKAQQFMEDLQFFIKKTAPIIFFPPYNILPFKNLSYHNETAAARINALYSLIAYESPPIVITSSNALLQKIIPKQKLSDFVELIMAGEDTDRNLLIEKLISGGYEHSVIVEEPGDFSVRGGIIDIFSPCYSNPVRIEFFGDTVDSLRFFSAYNQRKLKSIDEAVILPAKEAIIEKSNLKKLITRIREHAADIRIPFPKIRETLDYMEKENDFSAIESMISLIYDTPDTFFNYLPDDTFFTFIDPEESEKAAEEAWEQALKNFIEAQDENQLCIKPDEIYLKWSDLKKDIIDKKPLLLKALKVSLKKNEKNKEEDPLVQIDFQIKSNSILTTELKNFHGEENLLEPLAQWINSCKDSGYTILFVCATQSQTGRLTSLLEPYSVQIKTIEHFSDFEHLKNTVYVCTDQVSSGFLWPTEALAIVTGSEIFGPKNRRKQRPKHEIQTGLLAFGDLKKGNLIVHIEHGIGQYEGIAKLNLNGAINDFILIIYKDGDKLYLPVDRISMISNYMGVDGYKPVLDKMGGNTWDKVKKKVNKSVQKIAGELLKLYARRKANKGYAFLKTDDSFNNFEAGFPYEETEDQLTAIDDVLMDMKKTTPMDRLICGDAGYGKTEVALRASFKAVMENKQVAVLVPTTVLAEQHFETFSQRFKNYHINVECLSRFRTVKQQREIVKNLKNGKIDIIIGTHRLVQKDIDFKDLGLFVLDEEQRFGVKHKEKLKNLRTSVDVLTLTATPIPRTLHMSLLGVRDISIISTPPEHRQGIISYICNFDRGIIAEAIRKELKRKGQIFFIHNNIHNIWSMAKRLKEMVPEVRLDVAHGRLKEKELEKVMFRFINKEIDMLVCTTIVESGLDIPSANTIFINRADRFGLAQMYQLKGRVGRADEEAYAYLIIPDESLLPKNAQKRLKVLMEHNDIGAGFQIAMNDLKIRGGGAILGASQSGHIAAVGYDMFLKLMEKSVANLKGKPIIESLEPEVNIPISCYIPDSYIPDVDQRLSVYRRMAKMTELSELADFKQELTDRFGASPVETGNLIFKIILKILSIKAGVQKLDLLGNNLSLSFSVPHQKNPVKIADINIHQDKQFKITPDGMFHIELSKNKKTGLMVQVKNILKEIAQHVN